MGYGIFPKYQGDSEEARSCRGVPVGPGMWIWGQKNLPSGGGVGKDGGGVLTGRGGHGEGV